MAHGPNRNEHFEWQNSVGHRRRAGDWRGLRRRVGRSRGRRRRLLRSSGEIDAVAEKIRTTGRRALAVVCDVTEADQVRRMAEELNSQFGAVEILVNNVGLGRSHRFVDHPDELWDQMLAVNLTSVYRVTKAFVPKMIGMRRGRVINIASVMSKVGGKYVAAYAAAKHSVLGLTRALAVELVGCNITVNAVCPGYVNTPMTDDNVANIA